MSLWAHTGLRMRVDLTRAGFRQSIPHEMGVNVLLICWVHLQEPVIINNKENSEYLCIKNRWDRKWFLSTVSYRTGSNEKQGRYRQVVFLYRCYDSNIYNSYGIHNWIYWGKMRIQMNYIINLAWGCSTVMFRCTVGLWVVMYSLRTLPGVLCIVYSKYMIIWPCTAKVRMNINVEHP